MAIGIQGRITRSPFGYPQKHSEHEMPGDCRVLRCIYMQL